jgi:hypothetical protein
VRGTPPEPQKSRRNLWQLSPDSLNTHIAFHNAQQQAQQSAFTHTQPQGLPSSPLTNTKHNKAPMRRAMVKLAYQAGRRAGATGSPLEDHCLDQITTQASVAEPFVGAGPGKSCMETGGAHQIRHAAHRAANLGSSEMALAMPLPYSPLSSCARRNPRPSFDKGHRSNTEVVIDDKALTSSELSVVPTPQASLTFA